MGVDGILIEGYGSIDEFMLIGELLFVVKVLGDVVMGGMVNGSVVLIYCVIVIGSVMVLLCIIVMVE